MEWSIEVKPSYSILKVKLKPGEAVYAEPGAMVYMSSGVAVETKAQGGVLKSLLRSVFGGEGIVVELTGPGRVLIQTRSLPPFIELIAKYIRVQK